MTRSISRRVWAWIALVAALGVLATLVVLLFRNLGALAFALLALGIAAAAAWLVVTRRGIVRLLGVAVAIIALAGGAVALVRRGAVDELVAFTVALVAFGVASRLALRQAGGGRDVDQIRTAPRSS